MTLIHGLLSGKLHDLVEAGYCNGACYDWIRRNLLGSKNTLVKISGPDDKKIQILKAQTAQIALTQLAVKKSEQEISNQSYQTMSNKWDELEKAKDQAYATYVQLFNDYNENRNKVSKAEAAKMLLDFQNAENLYDTCEETFQNFKKNDPRVQNVPRMVRQWKDLSAKLDEVRREYRQGPGQNERFETSLQRPDCRPFS